MNYVKDEMEDVKDEMEDGQEIEDIRFVLPETRRKTFEKRVPFQSFPAFYMYTHFSIICCHYFYSNFEFLS